jgi:hypothetical protein
MVVGEPAQKILSFAEFVCGQWWWSLLNFGDDGVQAVTHRLPVVDRSAYVVEHTGDVLGKRLKANRFSDAIDLDVDERLAPRILGRGAGQADECSIGPALDRDDRMDDEVQHQPVAVDFHGHRIDEERHVVVDDFDDRVRRLPAVFLERRIEHADTGTARFPLAREVPVRQRCAVKVGRLPVGEILRVDIVEVARGEFLDGGSLARGYLRANEPQHLLKPL